MNEEKERLEAALRRLRRAEKILSTLCEAGVLTPADVGRVLKGEYHYYAVLKDGADFAGAISGSYVVVTNASSYQAARRAADNIIGKGNFVLRQEHTFDPAQHKEKFGEIDVATGETVVV